MGVGHTFALTPVGVFFGDRPGVTVPDPYFGGAGPARTGCIQCGECMTGCRHGAKNTLVKNYLYLAERLGVRGAPADHRDRAAAAHRRGLGRRDGAHRSVGGGAHPAYGHRRAGGARGRRLRHPAAAAPDARHRPAAAPVAAARRADPHQLRVAAGCAGPRRGTSTSAAASRSRRRSARRRTPTSSRCATGTARTRWGCSRSASPTATGRGRAGSPGWRDQVRDPRGFARSTAAARLVGAHDHRAGHAVGRQLAGRLRPAAARPLGADQQAGARRARTRPGSRPATRWSAGWPRSSTATPAATRPTWSARR